MPDNIGRNSELIGKFSLRQFRFYSITFDIFSKMIHKLIITENL